MKFIKPLYLLFLTLSLLLPLYNIAYSQGSGSITGTITDKKTDEILIGSNLLIVGTATGTTTDIDGKYVIRGLTPGQYSLRISYISYQSVTVNNIKVEEGKDTKIDVQLNPSTIELHEVVVSASVLKNTETNVLKIQMNSANIVDGISAELIRKNNSSDGTDVLKRMTGVTISEGKYAFVRGVGDRYNNTLLNGANLPSTDPEKKSFSYDIIPASLIENVITAKTSTPDKPADFSGGLIQITTIEFPQRFTTDFSLTSGINTYTSFKDFTGYSGGKTDFLGYDDGSRDYPSAISNLKLTRGNFTDDEILNIASSFKNNWNVNNKRVPMNGNMKLTIGDKMEFFDENILGYIGSVSYSNSFSAAENERNFYDFTGPRYLYNGNNYSNNVMWSGMLNFSVKFGMTNKISLKNVYNQNSDDEVTIFKGDYRYADQYREITSLRFVSRSLLSSQLLGEHRFDILNGLNFDWTFSYSQSERNEPDARRYVYSRGLDDPNEPLRFQLDQSLATRYFGNLLDHDFNGGTNFNLKVFESPELPKIKFGLFYNKKERNFDARLFGFKNVPGGNFLAEDSILQRSVEEIFSPENINRTFITVTEITKPSDSYESNQKVAAGYLMFDTNLLEKFRVAGGVRFEYSIQVLHSFSQTGENINVKKNYRDWLPGINLTYLLNNFINIRLAYSTTLARPEFRELAPFSYFDFITNELVQGNTELKRSLINNYDLRFEYFPKGGELVALSFFYKRFENPIEEILTASSSNEPIRSYANADAAKNYGVEIEIRKSLDFISDFVPYFSFVGNATVINSEVKLNNDEEINFQKSNRPLQGQADYVFNLGIYYDNFDLGLNSSIVYNKVGSRIAKVGANDLGDIIEKPVDLIDFSISKKLFQLFSIKFTVKDLLNQERLFIQRAPNGDKVSELSRVGRNISLGLSYQLN
ncbi:MAG: TonB-dependent receptor [Bacteroidota bacterium]|nr:TonB-dependent receptor [Bacteroidota bacterium]